MSLEMVGKLLLLCLAGDLQNENGHIQTLISTDCCVYKTQIHGSRFVQYEHLCFHMNCKDQLNEPDLRAGVS